MTTTPLVIGATGDVATSSLLWRFGGQLHLAVVVSARYGLVDEAVAPRLEALAFKHGVADPVGAPLRGPAEDLVPYRQFCDVWMVGQCEAQPLSPTAPLSTRLVLSGGHEVLLERQHRLMQGSDVGVAGYGPRRLTRMMAEMTRDGIVEIPQHFDWSTLQAAPTGQRVRHLEGGEWLVIEGVLATRNKIRCRLPQASAEARIWNRGSRPDDPGYPIHLVADTLGIDADSASFTVVWRGSFPIDDPSVPSRILVGAAVTDGPPVDWREIWILASAGAIGIGNTATLDMAPLSKPRGPAIPFDPGRPSQPGGQPLRPASMDGAPWSDGDASRPPPQPLQRDRAMTLDLAEGLGLGEPDPALPFRAPDAGDAVSWDDDMSPFEISSMETVDVPPPRGDEVATPFEESGAWQRANREDDE